jgi:alkanesulfonate monooxygenase SsuD/methylene tetrahydromethanopterin reductase-like flavin-dependent oxidoreductase (luciferase family)
MTRIGAVFSPYPNAPERLRETALAAEASGVAELWLWEDCFRQSAFAAASAALAWTEWLRVGIGIAPMPLRNVAATAMEIATIERMFPGRLLPGVGHGVLPWMGQVGARVPSPLTLMREYVPALRRLLADESVSVEGTHVALHDVRLDWPPAAAPRVYAAAEGPKTLALAGEVADGVILNSGYTPDEIGRAIDIVREGWRAAGREGAPDVVAYVRTAFGVDAGATAIAAFGSFDGPPPADVAERVAAGPVEAVADTVARFAAAGVDSVVLLPADEVDLGEFFAAAGEVARRVSA